MKYITPQAWASKYFSADSMPSNLTLRRWIKKGAIPGKKIGGSVFIDEDAWLAGGDELVARVLRGE